MCALLENSDMTTLYMVKGKENSSNIASVTLLAVMLSATCQRVG
jgi:hypothetical protein